MTGRRFAAYRQRHLNYHTKAGNIQKFGAGLSSDPIPRGAVGVKAGLAAHDDEHAAALVPLDAR